MAKFKIEIDTSSAAFDPNPGPELALLLREIANRAQLLEPKHYFTAPIRDTNGNTVGKCIYTK